MDTIEKLVWELTSDGKFYRDFLPYLRELRSYRLRGIPESQYIRIVLYKELYTYPIVRSVRPATYVMRNLVDNLLSYYEEQLSLEDG